MKTIFSLHHIYERIIDGVTLKTIKNIGFFESREECKGTIETHKDYEGFRDHPETCFKIFEYEMGREYWRDEMLTNVDGEDRLFKNRKTLGTDQ